MTLAATDNACADLVECKSFFNEIRDSMLVLPLGWYREEVILG